MIRRRYWAIQVVVRMPRQIQANSFDAKDTVKLGQILWRVF